MVDIKQGVIQYIDLVNYVTHRKQCWGHTCVMNWLVMHNKMLNMIYYLYNGISEPLWTENELALKQQ